MLPVARLQVSRKSNRIPFFNDQDASWWGNLLNNPLIRLFLSLPSLRPGQIWCIAYFGSSPCGKD
jgi:hypothetical protein